MLNTCGLHVHRRFKSSSCTFPPFALSRVVSLVPVSLIDLLSSCGQRLVRRRPKESAAGHPETSVWALQPFTACCVRLSEKS